MEFIGVLNKGTIEPVIISMRDKLETVDDMADVTNLRFDVKDSAGNAEVTNGLPTTAGMKVICVIDTTGAGWTTDEYRLYLKFTDGSTNPELLVGKFRVEDD